MNEKEIKRIAEVFAAKDMEFESHKVVETGRDYTGFAKSAEAALNLMTAAMFPKHFGEADGSGNEAVKRADYLQAARDALIKALRYVVDENAGAAGADNADGVASAAGADNADGVAGAAGADNANGVAGAAGFASVSEIADELIEELPEIMRLLKTDLVAAYQGDPAAKSVDEIILSYPAFKAISTYRIAHKLYQMKVDVLPRFFTELAHQTTGIDIHPGATIGEYFFIDHGTGVVIGETTTIGEHVKLYQHVTLGAKSFDVGDDGSLVKGIKRHPDIGNNVVIYAGATILGGETVIGDGAVVGGNTWLTHSVAAGETVTIME